MTKPPFYVRYPRISALLFGLAFAVAAVAIALLMQWGVGRFGTRAVLVAYLAVCIGTGTAWAIWADLRDARKRGQ